MLLMLDLPKKCYNHEKMKIYGLDFTSAPSLKKPITYAQCRLDEDGLFLERLGCLTSFDEFESFLSQPGPWTAEWIFHLASRVRSSKTSAGRKHGRTMSVLFPG
jgi:hypothetical protein